MQTTDDQRSKWYELVAVFGCGVALICFAQWFVAHFIGYPGVPLDIGEGGGTGISAYGIGLIIIVAVVGPEGFAILHRLLRSLRKRDRRGMTQ